MIRYGEGRNNALVTILLIVIALHVTQLSMKLLKVLLTQDTHPPRAGDIAVCWHCEEILLVDDITTVRLPTNTELIEIKNSKQWPAVEEISLVYRNRRIS